MILGIPKEIKDQEGRIAVIPEGVCKLVEWGHTVYVETTAGLKSGYSDFEYTRVGAKVVSKEEVWKCAQMIIKVKEPLESEYKYLRPQLLMFAFFHFSANPELKDICNNTGVIVFPYETIFLPDNSRPILRAMSRIAGEIAADVGTHYLRTENGGSGILLKDAAVSIIGAAGSAGKRAYEILKPRAGCIFAIDIVNHPLLGSDFRPSCPNAICNALRESNLVIGAAVKSGGGAPKLVTRKMVANMPRGSVLVDISIDEGGISETSRATSHSNPTYMDEGVIHYCVANIPGVVPRSSSHALTDASIEHILAIANKVR